jgi:hypothetical protein
VTTLNHKHYILDENDNTVEVDLLTWARWLEDCPHARIIGYTGITSEIAVSTVFLGLDHRFFGEGPPILFETLIFGGPLDGEGARYCSHDDALTGHKMLVQRARKAAGQKIKEERANVATPGDV